MCATEVMRLELEKNGNAKSLQEWLDVIRLSSVRTHVTKKSNVSQRVP